MRNVNDSPAAPQPRNQGGPGGARVRPARPRGMTLIELLVAMFITALIGMIVYVMYSGAIDSMNRMEKELRAFQSFRSAMDRLERDLSGICYKAGYVSWHKRAWYGPEPNYRYVGWYYDDASPMSTRFKPIHRSMLRICFRNRYMGFYKSADGRHIDRVEYYYNPPEARLKWANGTDDDQDDPGNGLDLLIDDKGCLMVRETPDSLPGGADPNPHLPFDPFKADPVGYLREPKVEDFGTQDGWGWPPWLIGGDILKEDFAGKMIDNGEIISDAVRDVQFWYMYSVLESDMPQFAHCWPYVGDPGDGDSMAGGAYPYKPGGGGATWDGDKSDKTGLIWPRADVDSASPGRTTDASGKQVLNPQRSSNRKGLSFMTLPQAVQVDFRFELGTNMEKRLSKTIWLHSSKWYELMTREMKRVQP